MIRYLEIRNLAVIEKVDLEVGPGLTVLTGETGAGKSILVEAVGLLVGGRASPDLVRTGTEAAVVQAVFDGPEGRELVVRREISVQGRSRAFLDDALVTAGGLKAACGALVDLHGQHDHQRLLDPDTHLDLLDQYGGYQDLRSRVADRFERLEGLRQALEAARRNIRDRDAHLDWLRFQVAQVDKVAPAAGEDEDLAATRVRLANAERLQRACTESYVALYEGDQAVLPVLSGIWRRIDDLAALDSAFGPYLELRAGVDAQLEDLAFFLRRYAAGIDGAPERLEAVEQRLASLERLKRSHGPTLQEVLQKRAQWEQELEALGGLDAHIEELEQAVQHAREEYLVEARRLGELRREAARCLTDRLADSLGQLAMPRARWEVRFTDAEFETAWTSRGLERVEFYFSANPGEDLRPLNRVASGGELSRITLAVKTLASTDAPGKTLIFDEVDAGIGGEVADVVGTKLRELGTRFQVLCITHLPQIAAYGSTHFRITKRIVGQRTITAVDRLAGAARIDEIARMIGGADVTASVRGSATDLLDRAGQSTENRTKGERRKGESESPRPKRRRVG
jgi:DNA repair protein RecN (Recombination protein N)